jgi:hypothetical protein
MMSERGARLRDLLMPLWPFRSKSVRISAVEVCLWLLRDCPSIVFAYLEWGRAKAWLKNGGAVFLVVAVASCASWQTRYLQEATNHATQNEVEERFGSPQDTWALATGEALWTYERGFQAGTESGGLTLVGPDWTIGRSPGCTASVLLFDQEKLLRAWMRQPCQSSSELPRSLSFLG